MEELGRDAGADVAARLLEQLTRTNERLEKLEAELRESETYATSADATLGAVGATEGPHRSRTSHEPAAPAPAAPAAPGGESPDELFRRGVALCQNDRFNEAIAAWQQVVRLEPDNVYALANLGIVYAEQSRWTEAHEMFARVLILQPDNVEAHYGLGLVHAQFGDYAAAVSDWETTLRLQPDNVDARHNLALVRERLAQQDTLAASSVVRTDRNGSHAPADLGNGHIDSTPDTAPLNGSANAVETVHVPEFARVGSPPLDGATRTATLDSRLHAVVSAPEHVRTARGVELSRRLPLRVAGISAGAVAALGMLVFFVSHPLTPAPRQAGPATGSPGAAAPIPRAAALPVGDAAGTSATVPSSPGSAAPAASRARRSADDHLELVSTHTRHASVRAARHLHVRSDATSEPVRDERHAHKQRHEKSASAAAESRPGFNQGADKLMDQLP